MSNTPDNKDDLVARIAKLEAKVDEINRKTLSNISVTDPTTQIKTLEIGQDAANSNRSFIKIRDTAGGIIMANDTVAGWGASAPNISYSLYPWNSWSAVQITSAGFQTTYTGQIFINMPRINFRMNREISGGGVLSTASMKVSWYQGANYATRTQMGATQSFPSATGYRAAESPLTYLWPSNMLGQYVYVVFEASLDTGAGGGNWCANTPIYLVGAGA